MLLCGRVAGVDQRLHFPNKEACKYSAIRIHLHIKSLKRAVTYGCQGKLATFTPVDDSGVGTDSRVASLCGSGTRVLMSLDSGVHLWSVGSDMKLTHLNVYDNYLLTSDDTHFVTGYSNTAYVYDLEAGSLLSTINSDESIISVRFIDNGAHLLVTDNDGVALYNTADGKVIARLFENRVFSHMLDACLINGGKNLAVMGTAGPSDYLISGSKAYIRILPFYASFEDVYDAAQEQLAGRTYDPDLDQDHMS